MGVVALAVAVAAAWAAPPSALAARPDPVVTLTSPGGNDLRGNQAGPGIEDSIIKPGYIVFDSACTYDVFQWTESRPGYYPVPYTRGFQSRDFTAAQIAAYPVDPPPAFMAAAQLQNNAVIWGRPFSSPVMEGAWNYSAPAAEVVTGDRWIRASSPYYSSWAGNGLVTYSSTWAAAGGSMFTATSGDSTRSRVESPPVGMPAPAYIGKAGALAAVVAVRGPGGLYDVVECYFAGQESGAASGATWKREYAGQTWDNVKNRISASFSTATQFQVQPQASPVNPEPPLYGAFIVRASSGYASLDTSSGVFAYEQLAALDATTAITTMANGSYDGDLYDEASGPSEEPTRSPSDFLSDPSAFATDTVPPVLRDLLPDWFEDMLSEVVQWFKDRLAMFDGLYWPFTFISSALVGGA